LKAKKAIYIYRERGKTVRSTVISETRQTYIEEKEEEEEDLNVLRAVFPL